MEHLLERKFVYEIVGCAMAVHNEIGHGLREKAYEKALCVELDHKNIPYSQQERFPVFYRDAQVDEYIPDLLVGRRVIVEAKTVENITDEHRGQVLNYLRISGVEVGLILNFKHPKLKWERLVLTQETAPSGAVS